MSTPWTPLQCACGCKNRVDGQFEDGRFYSWPCIWTRVRESELKLLRQAEDRAKVEAKDRVA